MTTTVQEPHVRRQYEALARQLRIDCIRMSVNAGSGHPTSGMSAADLMSVLMQRCLHYDFEDPTGPGNDRLIFSKGHASPLLYAMAKAAGAIDDAELMTYREHGSRLEGHPTPRFPAAQVATGSLGQGLPIGVGMALVAKRIEQVDSHVWVLHGDSEMAEGSVWEAIDKAGHYRLDNLIHILDMNRIGQRGPTALEWNGDAYARRAEAFGWRALQIDGHDVDEIAEAYDAAVESDRPTMVVARTVKGKGVSFLEDTSKWHGKAPSGEQAEEALEELGSIDPVGVKVRPPRDVEPAPLPEAQPLDLPTWEVGSEAATRDAYGATLRALGAAYPDLVVIDAEIGDSTRALKFAEEYPDRFFQMYIAEQQMIAAATGMAARGFRPFAATFGSFMSRAYDFVRMAAISRVDLRLCGSHAGVSIGEDGPSQMALEDLAMFRAVHGSTVLYPCDANQTATLMVHMAEREGISYLRTTRGDTPVIYGTDDEFPVGGSRTVRGSGEDDVTIVAAGITVHEALAAADALAEEDVSVCVIDAYSVKPLDEDGIHRAVEASGRRVIVAEDHWPEGGLGDAVWSALARRGIGELSVRHLAVRDMPLSGGSRDLLEAAGIGREAIADAVRELVG